MVLIHAQFQVTFSSPFDSYINGPTAHVFKVEQSGFTEASFLSLSDIHECSDGLQMVPSSLDKYTIGCDSPRDWLMSLAMDLAALCDMYR